MEVRRGALRPRRGALSRRRGALPPPRSPQPTEGRKAGKHPAALGLLPIQHPSLTAAPFLPVCRCPAARPEIAAATAYDGEAVLEDLDNATALTPIVEKIAELDQRISDTRLSWLAEAWVPSLAAYAVAKVRAKSDGALRTVVDPMAAVFATRRGRPAKAATPAPDDTPANK